jgi:hypothetical protein
MSRSRAKGTAAESATVAALWRLGFPYAERRALSGANDLGDITGTPGLAWEVKDAKVWQAAAWLRETEVERVNAKADFGILVIKTPGVGAPNAHRWLTVMDGDCADNLRKEASVKAPWRPARRVSLGAVGIGKGLEEMIERERHCGTTPVEVFVKRQRTAEMAPGAQAGFYNLMRLDTRCQLLVDAGYGGYGIMDKQPSMITQECHNE